jgi:cytochrome c oxidase cbb3-type subunit 3
MRLAQASAGIVSLGVRRLELEGRRGSHAVRCVPLVAAVLVLPLSLVACEREQRRFVDVAASRGPGRSTVSALQAGEPRPRPSWSRGPYAENAWAVSEGKRLYSWFNCVGCHAHGGGGIGPPLMDDKWIYGGEPANIFASIVDGRPNGMPAFGSRIPPQQVWQIVAYVQSMSGALRKDVRPGRDDALYVGPSEQARSPEPSARHPRGDPRGVSQ